MIGNGSHPIAWTLLVMELDDAQAHLKSLINEMIAQGVLEEEEFQSALGHIYAHLNRA